MTPYASTLTSRQLPVDVKLSNGASGAHIEAVQTCFMILLHWQKKFNRHRTWAKRVAQSQQRPTPIIGAALPHASFIHTADFAFVEPTGFEQAALGMFDHLLLRRFCSAGWTAQHITTVGLHIPSATLIV